MPMTSPSGPLLVLMPMTHTPPLSSPNGPLPPSLVIHTARQGKRKDAAAVWVLGGHTDAVTSVAWSPGGDTIGGCLTSPYLAPI